MKIRSYFKEVSVVTGSKFFIVEVPTELFYDFSDLLFINYKNRPYASMSGIKYETMLGLIFEEHEK